MYNLTTNPNLINYDTKNEVDSLIPNINLVDYFIKNEVDTLLYAIYPNLTLLVDSVYLLSWFITK